MFVKAGGGQLVSKARLLFLAAATCPAKSSGLIFPILGVSVLKGLPSPPHPRPPCPLHLQAHSSLLAGAGFDFGPSQVSNRGCRREPLGLGGWWGGALPAWARLAGPTGALCQGEHNEQSWPGPGLREAQAFPQRRRQNHHRGNPCCCFRPKEEGRKKAFFPNMDKSRSRLQTFARSEQRR